MSEDREEESFLEKNGNDYKKKRIVILGSGWAAASLLRNISTKLYEVVIISPRNYFLFTPLLPGVTVGSVEMRSIIEPIRSMSADLGQKITYYEAKATGIDLKESKVTCKGVSSEHGNTFDLHYDHLVVAVGSYNNTFNTPGVVENCHFVKEIDDAQKIRAKIMGCFENAFLPNRTEEEKQKLLHFVVVGGGPTGVEFVGELYDFIQEDLIKEFPQMVPKVKITLVQSAGTLLNTYDQAISDYVMKSFSTKKIEVKTNSRVTEVSPDTITILDKGTNKTSTVPYGLCVWSTGNDSHPLVKEIQSQIKKLEEEPKGNVKPYRKQSNNKALLTNPFFEVELPISGDGVGKVYALGDCSTVDNKKMVDRISDLFDLADVDKNGQLSSAEVVTFLEAQKTNYPHVAHFTHNIKKLFEASDKDHSGSLCKEEFKTLLQNVDKEVRSLPSTAQAAAQEGKYLGRALNAKAMGKEILPFRYRHLGQFASIGNEEAVLEVATDHKNVIFAGFSTFWLWRAYYLEEQVSWKTKVLLGFDWLKTSMFGRDTSKI